MVNELTIETISDDNKKSLFRSLQIKVNGKKISTPSKTLEPEKFRSEISLNENAYGINEMYKEIDSNKINILSKDRNKLDQFSRELKNICNKGKSTDIKLFLTKFKSNGKVFPSERENDFLADVIHSYSDLIITPMIDIDIDDSNIKLFQNYFDSFYKSIQELDDGPVMGFLPNLPREQYPNMINFYLKYNIKSFYFDFNGKTPDHLKLRPILRHLKRNKLLDECLLYGINAKPGKVLKNTEIIPSKDFISYGYGLDILGQSHIGLKGTREFFDKMRIAIKQQQENKKRIFIKLDYGYHQILQNQENFEFSVDTKIPFSKIRDDKSKVWLKLFNMEQQSLEAKELKKRLLELDPNESIMEYIKNKLYIQKELNHLNSGMKGISK